MSYIFGLVIISACSVVSVVLVSLMLSNNTQLPQLVNFTETAPLNPNTTLIPASNDVNVCVANAQTTCSNLTTNLLWAAGNLTIRTAERLNETKYAVIGNCSAQVAALQLAINNVTQRNPPTLLQSGTYSVAPGGGSGAYHLYKWKHSELSIYYTLISGGSWSASTVSTLSMTFSPPLCNASFVSGGIKPLLPTQLSKFQPSNVLNNVQTGCSSITFYGSGGVVSLTGQINLIL